MIDTGMSKCESHFRKLIFRDSLTFLYRANVEQVFQVLLHYIMSSFALMALHCFANYKSNCWPHPPPPSLEPTDFGEGCDHSQSNLYI